MPSRPGTFELAAMELARALEPLAARFESSDTALTFLAELGLKLPHGAVSGGLTQALDATRTAAGDLPALTEGLVTAITGGDAADILANGVSVAVQVGVVIDAFDRIGTEIGALGAVPGIAAPDLGAFAAALPGRLFETLLIDYFEGQHEIPLSLLEMVGIFEQARHNVGSTDPGNPEFVAKAFRPDRIGELLQDPGALLASLYDWGQPTIDVEVLLSRVASLLRSFGIPITYLELPGTPPRPSIEVCVLTLAPTEGLSPPGLEAALTGDVADGFSIDLAFAAGWIAHLEAEGALSARAALRVQPPADVSVEPPSGSAQGRLRLGIARVPVPPDPSIVLLGVAGGTGLTVGRIGLNLVAGFSWDAATGRAVGDLGFEGELRDGKLKIDLSGADGFLGEILGGVEIEADFNLGFGWTSGQGVYFTGSSTLEIQLPVHIALGPIDLDALTLSVGVDGRTFPIGLTTNIGASLGPIQAVVEQIGAAVELSFPPGGDGDVGPLDVGFRFRPPRGAGLSLDAGPVKGGGYLFFDPDREEYAGALELVFSEWIALRAIGLITTRLPDGSSGFSLLILITVEFGSGIQLGFGFTLLGVGGLVGIHRIVKVEPLKEGIRTGAVESVMFPQDVIANAPRIISDLRKFFPPQSDVHLLGPMVKIGWGTPTLLSASVGIIVEVPSVNMTILGVIKVVLPDEQAAVLKLQVNFMGRIEPSNKLLWFYAELFDSRVLFITLEGGMGLLVSWGDAANFVVSVGGFHPRYSPPPLPFPAPPRLAVSILNESYARVRVEAYFAVTSNSVQFGAKAELFFGLSEFGIEGHLAFDALFQFDPFFFSFGLSVSLSVKVFGVGLFSVGFSGLLEGPTPWHIEGKGSISLLFFDISVPFSHTWGGEKDTRLDPIEVFPLLEFELGALTNWKAQLPAGSNVSVSLRKLGESESDQLVLHPVGTLRISQRKVPLNFKLDKVGNQRPSDVTQLFLEATLAGSEELAVSTIQERFAVGQFRDLADSDRLSQPGFELQDSGVEIAAKGEQLKASQAVKRVIRYESIIIDSYYRRFVRRSYHFFKLGYAVLNEFLFKHFLAGNSATKSVLSRHHKNRLTPFDEVIEVKPVEYSVVSVEDNTPDDPSLSFSSYASATQFMEEQIAEDRTLADRLQVVPSTEVNAGL